MKAIGIIQDEHRSITAVIEGLVHLVDELQKGQLAPDHALLAALLGYIERFPEQLHHPKEDSYLFAALRFRRPDVAPLLEALEREHAVGRDRFAELDALRQRYVDNPAALAAFADAVRRYAHFHWKHMRREEDEVLPLARAALTGADWEAIDAAFGANGDPLFGMGARHELRELFRRIVATMPPPYGVGPEPPARR